MRILILTIFSFLFSCSNDSEEYTVVEFGKTNENPAITDALLFAEEVSGNKEYKIMYPESEEDLAGVLYSLGKGDVIKLKNPKAYGYQKDVILTLIDFKESTKVRGFDEGIVDFSEDEKIEIALFLFQTDIDFQFDKGMFVSWVKKSNSGIKGIKNSIYKIDMECELLDGTKVYSTDLSRSLFEFNKSMPDQVTEGLSMMIDDMEEGDELILLVPSKLSFGEKGVRGGLVPPNAPLFYRLKIIEIII